MATSHKTIEEQFLPREMKLDLCASLLEDMGADKINVREHRDEIIHCCVLPWHTESKPSASLNFEKLTYRCLGCNSKGGFLWLIETAMGLHNGAEAKEWLAGVSGFGGSEFQLGPLLDFLDNLESAFKAGRRHPVLPRYSEKVLEPWNYICPLLTTGAPDLGVEGRGIPEENLVKARVGWDMEENRVIIPLWVDGDLVGWQSRRLTSDGTPKYKSTPDFPRDTSILGLPKDRSLVIVVESPMNYLRHLHHLPVAATWGTSITQQQIEMLKWYDEVCFWGDNDPAGWQMVEGRWSEPSPGKRPQFYPGPAQLLEAYTRVTSVESDWHADAAQIDDEEAERLVRERVPVSIWERPKGCLRCILCKEKHSGPCEIERG